MRYRMYVDFCLLPAPSGLILERTSASSILRLQCNSIGNEPCLPGSVRANRTGLSRLDDRPSANLAGLPFLASYPLFRELGSTARCWSVPITGTSHAALSWVRFSAGRGSFPVPVRRGCYVRLDGDSLSFPRSGLRLGIAECLRRVEFDGIGEGCSFVMPDHLNADGSWPIVKPSEWRARLTWPGTRISSCRRTTSLRFFPASSRTDLRSGARLASFRGLNESN